MTAAPPTVHITYFTDPLCSWSWAFETVRVRLVEDYGNTVAWTYRMGGLLPNWQVFRDPVNAVNTPAQLAPAWYAVARATGASINEAIWREDPPTSSFPACLAVKAAASQGADAEEQYLVALRTAVMTQKVNIARSSALVRIAAELAGRMDFDAHRFAADLRTSDARERFAADLRECRVQQIGRFPTFVVRGPQASRIVVGYRPHDVLAQVLVAVGLPPPARARHAPDQKSGELGAGGCRARDAG